MRVNPIMSLGDTRSPAFSTPSRGGHLLSFPHGAVIDGLEAVERRMDAGDVESAAGELDRLRATLDRPDHVPGLAALARRLAWIRGRDLPDLEGASAMVPASRGSPLCRRQILDLQALTRVALRQGWTEVVTRALRCLKSRGLRMEPADALRSLVLRGTSLLRQGRRSEGADLLDAGLRGAADPARPIQDAVLALIEVSALGTARAILERHRAAMAGVWGRLIETRLLLAEGQPAVALRLLPDPVFPVPRYLASVLRATAAPASGEAGFLSQDPVLATECQWVLDEFGLEGVRDHLSSSAKDRRAISARSRDLLMTRWLASGETVIDITRRRIGRRGLPDLELGGRVAPLRLLRELIAAGPAGASKPQLFQAVFGQRYNPEVHDRNVYSTIKRLRNIVDEWCGERSWIVTSGTGRFALDPRLEWRLLEPLPLAERWGLDPTQDAVMGALEAGPLSLVEIESRAGKGETTLRRALRALLARALVVRVPGHEGVLYRRARHLMG